MKKLFLTSNKSSECTYLSGDKIELIMCNTGPQNCKEHLQKINKCYVEAHDYRLENDYSSSIESLKCAFYKTCDLQEDTCKKCVEFFRSTITKSVENINVELQDLTTGIFINRNYVLSFNKSSDFLQDIKKEFGN